MNIYNQFTPDQYCVYHTTYSGTLMPQNYIGSTLVDNILNKNYHGSVKSKKYKSIWKSELKEHPELFNTVIISYHDTRSDAVWKECKIQKTFNVIESEDFINMAYACANGFYNILRGSDHPNYYTACKDFSLISPTGIIHKGKNIKQFCLINRLDYSNTCKVLSGNRQNHKGWISADDDILLYWSKESLKRKCDRITKVSMTLSKTFSLLDPEGNTHIGINLKKFCIDNNLTPANIYKVLSGKRNHHKGWTKLRPEI